MLHLDIPSAEQFRRLSEIRADACVSLYLPTTALSQEAAAMRTALGQLIRTAESQAGEGGLARGRLASLREHLDDLIDDDAFWRLQARSLAVLVTADHIDTFRLANDLPAQAHVSDRFHLKPLLRAVTFPHAALVLALSENGMRLVEILPEGPPVPVRVEDAPRDAASAAGKASLNDRSHSGRVHGSEGKKVRLTQYARKVDAALRPLLAGRPEPLFLAAAEPLGSIFRGVCSAPFLAPETIAGNPDRIADAELAAAARLGLDRLHAAEIAAWRALFAQRAEAGRTTTDLAQAGQAAARGAIESLLVDIDAMIPGRFDETSGAIEFAEVEGHASHGIADAIATQAMATGARVLGVRQADLPEGAPLAAILRYPM